MFRKTILTTGAVLAITLGASAINVRDAVAAGSGIVLSLGHGGHHSGHGIHTKILNGIHLGVHNGGHQNGHHGGHQNGHHNGQHNGHHNGQHNGHHGGGHGGGH